MVLVFDFDPPPGAIEEAPARAASLAEVMTQIQAGSSEVVVLGPAADDIDAFVQGIDESLPPVGLLFVVGAEHADRPSSALVRCLPARDAANPIVLRATIGELRACARMARKDREVARIQKLQIDLLSMVAHDIRAPLGVIVGALNELSNKDVGETNDEQRFLLALVRRSVERLTRLATNLSFLGRMEAGRIELRRRPTDLRAVVRQVVDDAQRIDAGTQVTIAFEAPAEAVTADVDGERIAQVTSNLVSNAVRFAKKHVKVALRLDGDRVVLEVVDDGPGIPADHLWKIFERFSRLDAPKSGTGLGLAIVRGIVEAHGGAVAAANLPPANEADAQKNKPAGAAFTVRLPVSPPTR